ncbi:MAG: hypothetical protein M0R75_15545, partial [Dehalococcoidia bacterium]|nr:hypothetical protein [Dehalococcoidia bacterium]
MTMQSTPRPTQHVARLGGQRYFLASDEELKSIEGVRRSWDTTRRPRQMGDADEPFQIPMVSFHRGFGFTFAPDAGVYEEADSWDLSSFARARGWPRLCTTESLTTTNRRGWWHYHASTGFAYLFRGQYAAKYRPDTTADGEWAIEELHYFGADRVVADWPVEFDEKIYVPLLNTGTDAGARWHELTPAEPVEGVQTLTMSGSPTGGTWTVTYNDGVQDTESASLDHDATAAEVQTALRAIPGLQKVTVARTGSSPNYVWTVTMTAAPTDLASDDVPAFTATSSSLTGGSSPTVTPAIDTAGTGDTWALAEATVEATNFCVWNKPGVGPLLVRGNGNKVATCATTPTTAANWSAEYSVGDDSARITALVEWFQYLMVGKEDGLYSFDETSTARPEIKSLLLVRDRGNFVGMVEHNGFLYCPHRVGLIRWTPGNWLIVGAEQDGWMEGDRSAGFGQTMGLAPYGKFLYTSVYDQLNQRGLVGSLTPGQERGPLTPHMHQALTTPVEHCAVLSFDRGQVEVAFDDAVSDDASGTAAWSDPTNALVDSTTYASASGDGETTELLTLGIAAGEHVPADATVTGLAARVRRYGDPPWTNEFAAPAS